MKSYMIMGNEYFTYLEIEEMVKRLRPDYHLLCVREDTGSSTEYLNSHNVDLIIADIELSDGSSADAIRSAGCCATPVIFATPYRNGNPELSDINVIDYLPKPVSETALLRSMAKLENDGNHNI